MEILYRVNSVARETSQRLVTLTETDQEVLAGVGVICLELVEVDGTDTLTRRFVPDDMESALELYAVGTVIVATLAPKEA